MAGRRDTAGSSLRRLSSLQHRIYNRLGPQSAHLWLTLALAKLQAASVTSLGTEAWDRRIVLFQNAA